MATRGYYNLMRSCVAAGVSRVICLGTMDAFLPYPPTAAVDMQYKPKPSVAPHILGPHLTEFLCKELARSQPVSVVIARLGSGAPDARFRLSPAEATAAVAEVLSPGWLPAGWINPAGGGEANPFAPMLLGCLERGEESG